MKIWNKIKELCKYFVKQRYHLHSFYGYLGGWIFTIFMLTFLQMDIPFLLTVLVGTIPITTYAWIRENEKQRKSGGVTPFDEWDVFFTWLFALFGAITAMLTWHWYQDNVLVHFGWLSEWFYSKD